MKLYRAQLPAPEDIQPVPEPRGNQRQDKRGSQDREKSPREKPPHEKPAREKPQREKPSRAGMANGVWFKITVGRERNADPKWLLPEICRQGDITKQDIGSICVYDTETRFEVDPRVAEQFTTLVAARKKGGVRIFPAPDAPPQVSAPEYAPEKLKYSPYPKRPASKGKPQGSPKEPVTGPQKSKNNRTFAKKRKERR